MSIGRDGGGERRVAGVDSGRIIIIIRLDGGGYPHLIARGKAVNAAPRALGGRGWTGTGVGRGWDGRVIE